MSGLGGITGLQRQLQLIRNVKGPPPSEQAGKPYHIWQQRENLIFINERSERDSGLRRKGRAPILNGVLHILVSAQEKKSRRPGSARTGRGPMEVV